MDRAVDGAMSVFAVWEANLAEDIFPNLYIAYRNIIHIIFFTQKILHDNTDFLNDFLWAFLAIVTRNPALDVVLHCTPVFSVSGDISELKIPFEVSAPIQMYVSVQLSTNSFYCLMITLPIIAIQRWEITQMYDDCTDKMGFMREGKEVGKGLPKSDAEGLLRLSYLFVSGKGHVPMKGECLRCRRPCDRLWVDHLPGPHRSRSGTRPLTFKG